MKRKKFDSKPVFTEKYVKIKLKSYNKKKNHDKALKEGLEYLCLSAIVLDSVLKFSKNYYPQMLLEEYKYKMKQQVLKIIKKR